MKVLSLICLALLFVQCQSIKQTTDEKSIEQIAQDVFGKNVNIKYNTEKTFAIFVTEKKPDMENPVNALEFGIFNMEKKALVYREQKYNARVGWYNNTHVVVNSRPGVKSLNPEEDKLMREYYINTQTLEKTSEQPN